MKTRFFEKMAAFGLVIFASIIISAGSALTATYDATGQWSVNAYNL